MSKPTNVYVLALTNKSTTDYIGLDTMIFIVQGWVDKYPDEPSFVIPKCLKELVDAGHLGRKTGRGFYTWDGDKRGDPAY